MNKKFLKHIIPTLLIAMLFLSIYIIIFYSKEYKKDETSHIDIKTLDSISEPIPVEVKTIEDIYEEAILEMQTKMDDLNANVTDKKQWFIGYKEIITEYEGIIDPPETIYDYYTEDELNMLFRVVQAEIGDEYSFEQKCNVASVIFNRLAHDEFENEMLKVLTSDQFSTISNGRYKNVDVSEETILACEYVFCIEDTTDGCLFFDSNESLKYEFVFNDGAHNFYKIKGEN